MAGPDGASGRIKADVQRDTALLFVGGLMHCAYINRQDGEESGLLPLKIMIILAGESAEVRLHLIPNWQAVGKTAGDASRSIDATKN